MSNLTVRGNTSGTGTIILESPNTNTNRTITLPDATATLASTAYVDSSVATAARMVTGTAVASTSGTAVDFTGIPSWAKRVTVMFSGVSTSGTSIVQVQVGSTTFSTSGYVSSIALINGGTGQGGLTTGLAVLTPASAANASSGFVALSLINSNQWVLSGNLQTTAATGAIFMVAGSSPSLAGALDRIRITTVNGTDTFDAGTINIMWEG